jgi:small subunit ribosomal protein S1
MPDDRTSPDETRTAPDEIKQTTSDDKSSAGSESAPAQPRQSEGMTTKTPTATEIAPKDETTREAEATTTANADAAASASSDAPTPNGAGQAAGADAATADAPTPTGAAHDANSNGTAQGANAAGDAAHAPTPNGVVQENEVVQDTSAAPAAEEAPSGAEPGTADVPSTASTAVEAADTKDAPASAADEQDESSDFGKALDASAKQPRVVKVGERVRGKIVTIEEQHCFIDYKGRAEARIATSELRDRDGSVLMRVNDLITATVADVDDGVTLTLGKRRGPVNAARLRVSFENKVPVSGTVKGINKGGFDVNVGGIRAFCPLSQVDNRYIENPKDYVGKTFRFRVLRWENGGRNIVVSRRPILREETKRRASETRARLDEGAEFEGVVTRLQPFGAFVDLGGLEGLLHVSRMGYTRVENPSAVVTKGDKVRVRVVSIENPGTRKERIALALADLGPDPWDAVHDELKEGDVLTGTVARMVPFGAFVRLPNGMDGLVHVSELSADRVKEPQEDLVQGQEVKVRVLRIDVEKKRISLSLRLSAERGKPKPKPRREPRAARGAPSQPKTGPPDASSVSLTHTMADQLGRLKDKLREKD